MNNQVLAFFKSKMNIAMVIIQCLALIFFAINVHAVFFVLFILCQGVFFVLWGIKHFLQIKCLQKNMAIHSQLPYSPQQLITLAKNSKSQIISMRIQGILLLSLGGVIICYLFTLL